MGEWYEELAGKQRQRAVDSSVSESRSKHAAGKQTRTSALALQRRERGEPTGDNAHAAADAGVAGADEALPFGSQIQASFGQHDIGEIKTRTGGPAREAGQALGASAYAFGGCIGFSESPDLHTAAHEAAHVVQQRGGVSLYGGVGQAGDPYEQHADRVADLVVAGKSAESALDEMSSAGGATRAVQRQESDEPGECMQPEEEAEPTFFDDPLAALREAVEIGVDELSRVAKQIPVPDLAEALKLFPEIAGQLISYWWPNHTGWSLSAEAGANGKADFLVGGVPLSVSLEGSGSVTLTIRRTDASLVLEAKPGLEGDLEGAGTIKLVKLPIDAITTAASTLTLTTDLGRVDWSADAIVALKNGDFQGALAAVLETGISLARNTQLKTTMDVKNAMEGGVEMGLDDQFNGFVKAAVGLGLKTTIQNPTEGATGQLQVEGYGETMAQLGIEGEKLPKEAPAVVKLIKKLVEFEATAKSKATVRLKMTLPKLASEETPDPGGVGMSVSILGGFTVGGKIAGQKGEGGATHEIRLGLNDIPAFIASLDDGSFADAGNELLAGSGYGLQLDGRLDLAKIGLIDALKTWFPSLASEKFPEKFMAKIQAKFFLSGDRIAGVATETGGRFMEFFQAAFEGGLENALVSFADLALGNMETVHALIESVTIEFSSTLFNKEGEAETLLGIGEVGGKASGSVAAMFKRKLSRDEVPLDVLASYLRGVISGEAG